MEALIKLRDELEHARNQYHLAQFIDSTARMMEEQTYWSGRINTINEKIAEIEGDE